MPIFKVYGISIDFPYVPYSIQKDYMEKVIDCLENEHNAVLESPTGTGKTLSLLCSSLGWLTAKKVLYKKLNRMDECADSKCGADLDCLGPGKIVRTLPTIIYASRTHTQLTQAMQELKKTAYKNVKAVVIGSREQMCIHPDVEKLEDNSSKIHLCQSYVKMRMCHFFNRVEHVKGQIMADSEVIDIEDLINIGKSKRCCPFYLAKELKENADIIFMPYNYLMTEKNRRNLGLSLKNSVIIVDEAHNIENLCEESASSQIRINDIAIAIREITQLMETYDLLDFDKAQKEFSQEELMQVKIILMALEEKLTDIPLDSSTNSKTFGGAYVFEFLKECKLNDNNMSKILSLLDAMSSMLSLNGNNLNQLKGNGLQSVLDFLLIVKNSTNNKHFSKEDINHCFKVYVNVETKMTDHSHGGGWLSQSTAAKEIKVLSFWCFSPGFGMQMILQHEIRSMILTSGTLAPLAPLINELQINVKVQLENNHVISKEQIFIKIIQKGPDGELFTSAYTNRDNLKYISSLGTAISNYSRVIPGGLLIFFPSYTYLFKCTEEWKASGMWSTIYQKKKIFLESKNKTIFQSNITDYYNVVQKDKNGAIFMGVCRGKISEGLDFADINGRAVIITGLPYPPLKDPRVMLKREYLDKSKSKGLSGSDWYNLEAIRAVNQAIGRVIRHKNDFGAILLLDSRFSNPTMINRLSKWLRDKIIPCKFFGESIRDLNLFFKNIPKFDSNGGPEISSSAVLTPLSLTSQSSSSSSSSSSLSVDDNNISPYFKSSSSELPTAKRQRKRFKVELKNIFEQ